MIPNGSERFRWDVLRSNNDGAPASGLYAHILERNCLLADN